LNYGTGCKVVPESTVKILKERKDLFVAIFPTLFLEVVSVKVHHLSVLLHGMMVA